MDMLRALYIALVVLLCGVMGEACAQDLAKADSLKEVLAARKGKERCEVLFLLAREYSDQLHDNEMALSCTREAYMLARVAPVDSLLLVKCGRRNATILRRREYYDQAFAILDSILPIARRNNFKEEVDLCLSMAGLMHGALGHYDKALTLDLECLNLRMQTGNQFDLSITLNNIGFIYYELANYEKALSYFLLSLKSKEAANTDYDKDLLYVNIGLCYSYLENYSLALEYVNKGLRDCRESCDNYLEANGYLALGLVYMNLANKALAEDYLSRSYKASVSAGNTRFKAESLFLLGELALGSRMYNKALYYFRDAEHEALKINSKFLLNDIYGGLFRATLLLTNYEGAVNYWDRHAAYSDSVFSEKVIISTVDSQVSYDQQQNQAELALQESTVQWQGRQNFWIALIGGLLIIVIELLIYDYTGRKRETQRLEAMVHDRTRTLKEKVRSLERQETERKAWEQKIDKAVYDGTTRLTVLGNLIGLDNAKTTLQQLKDLQEGKHPTIGDDQK